MSASSSAPTTNIPHPVVIGYEAANAPPTNICTGLQSSFISVEQVCMYVCMYVCIIRTNISGREIVLRKILPSWKFTSFFFWDK